MSRVQLPGGPVTVEVYAWEVWEGGRAIGVVKRYSKTWWAESFGGRERSFPTRAGALVWLQEQARREQPVLV